MCCTMSITWRAQWFAFDHEKYFLDTIMRVLGHNAVAPLRRFFFFFFPVKVYNIIEFTYILLLLLQHL